MAVSLIDNFSVQKSISIDVRYFVPDQAGRLAIVYPYLGLRTKQLDTNQIFQYITTTPTDGDRKSVV